MTELQIYLQKYSESKLEGYQNLEKQNISNKTQQPQYINAYITTITNEPGQRKFFIQLIKALRYGQVRRKREYKIIFHRQIKKCNNLLGCVIFTSPQDLIKIDFLIMEDQLNNDLLYSFGFT